MSDPSESIPQTHDARHEAKPTAARDQAMTALFREHNRALINFLAARLQNEDEAREVAQEAYVRLLQLHEPVATSFLRWYLFKIAKDLAVDRHRQRATRSRLDRLEGSQEIEAFSSPTECSVMAADELATLRVALSELPPRCQESFLLHRFDGLSTVEIAQRLQLSDRMVRKHIKRALVYCRLRLAGLPRDISMDSGS